MVLRLDDVDVRIVLDAAATLVADPTPRIDQVLETLRALIPCTSASFNDMTLAAGDFRYVIVPADDERLAEALKPVYDRLAATQHPLIGAILMEPTSGALRFCDVPGGATFTDTELYAEFFVPFGLRYQMAIQLPAPPDVIVGYALNRSSTEGEFSDRDVDVLNALGPHLAMHHRLLVDRERTRAMAAEVDLHGGWTVMTVRADGMIDASTSADAAGSFAPDGHLPTTLLDRLPSYRSMPHRSSTCDVDVDGTSWRCVIHPVPAGPTVLLVRRLGDPAGDLAGAAGNGSGDVVAPPLLGLTPRQLDVATLLVRSGGTNAQLAQSLGMSEGTVKKHLEAIFRVLGVDSRAAAIVAITELGRPSGS